MCQRCVRAETMFDTSQARCNDCELSGENPKLEWFISKVETKSVKKMIPFLREGGSRGIEDVKEIQQYIREDRTVTPEMVSRRVAEYLLPNTSERISQAKVKHRKEELATISLFWAAREGKLTEQDFQNLIAVQLNRFNGFYANVNLLLETAEVKNLINATQASEGHRLAQLRRTFIEKANRAGIKAADGEIPNRR